MTSRLGIVGGGWLGTAIARAALRQGMVTPDAVTLSYRSRAPDMPDGVVLTRDNRALCGGADIIIIAVRPQDWAALDLEIDGKLMISVMAGVRSDALAGRHGTDRLIRALPNAAADVGASYTPLWAAPGAHAGDLALARQIFQCCGAVDEVDEEDHLDYLCALTGTGPAYPALMADAMVRDAIDRGLPAHVATRAVNMLFVGTGRLIEANAADPHATVETFMAYRGVTAAGLEAMAASGFEAAVRHGLASAYARTRDMSGATTRRDDAPGSR